MIRVPDGDFDHPALAQGDPLRAHLTYAIDRPRAGASQGVGSSAPIAAMPVPSRAVSAVARARSASSAG